MSEHSKENAIFISYSHSDKSLLNWIKNLVRLLRGNNMNVWPDQLEVRPGENFFEIERTALQSSYVVLAMCTPHYKQMLERQEKERDTRSHAFLLREAIQGTRKQPREKFIIPLLLEGNVEESVPSWLAQFKPVFFSKQRLSVENERYQELLNVIRQDIQSAEPHQWTEFLEYLPATELGTLVPLTIAIDQDYEKYTFNQAQSLIKTLANFLNLPSAPKILNIEKGSVNITLEIPFEQAQRLISLCRMGMLDQLSIKDVKIIGNAAAASIVKRKAQDNNYDVFMCHNSEDKTEVKRIAINLRARGLLPWLDEWELRPGVPWQVELQKQIGNIKSAAVFVGDTGIGPWQNMEVSAFISQFVQRNCPVIPAILRSCKSKPDFPPFLNGMTWVDFHKKNPDPYEYLIWGITGIKHQPLCCS